MHKRFFIKLVVMLLVLMTGCNRLSELDQITIAVPAVPLSTPVLVAYEEGFFEREGLHVTLQKQEIGIDALQSVIKGTADFCSTAEPPIMFAGLAGEKIAVIATVADSNKYVKIFGRRDRGIAKPADLQGKTVAVRKGTASEYFLGLFLAYYQVPTESVKIVDMKFMDMPDALARGSVDAVVDWAPYLVQQQRRLGANGITLWAEHLYTMTGNIVAKREYVDEHRETTQKLLRALIRAERFIWDHQEEAQKIVNDHVAGFSAQLSDFNFDVRLSQSLVHALEDEARWAIAARNLKGKKVPNYLSLIHRDALEAVSPESISLSGGER